MEYSSNEKEFSILNFTFPNQKVKTNNLSALFLCQFNEEPELLKRPRNEINASNLIDYSHKFLLDVPIYFTALLSIGNLALLMKKRGEEFEKDFSRLVSYINLHDMIIKSSPATNQQPIIKCFILTAVTWLDYEFFKKIQKEHDCFYDFEFIDHEQFIYMEFGMNPGKVFSFKNIPLNAKQVKNLVLNNQIERMKSENFLKFKVFADNNLNGKSYRELIKSIFVDPKTGIFLETASNLKSWTSMAYDIEVGRITTSKCKEEESKSFPTPLDSYVQTICCLVAGSSNFAFNNTCRIDELIKISNQFCFKIFIFVFLRDKNWSAQIIEYFEKKKNTWCLLIFDNEREMLEEFLLFANMFNQIVDQNGMKFDLPFIVNRINLLKQNFDYINHFSLTWPFSVSSPNTREIYLKCNFINELGVKCNYPTSISHGKCKKCLNNLVKKKEDFLLVNHKNPKITMKSYPLAVHIDLQNREWSPNNDLIKATNKSSLRALSQHWFKSEITHHILLKDTLYLFSNIIKIEEYLEQCQRFGKNGNQLIWFLYDKDLNLQSDLIGGILENLDFFYYDENVFKSLEEKFIHTYNPFDEKRLHVQNSENIHQNFYKSGKKLEKSSTAVGFVLYKLKTNLYNQKNLSNIKSLNSLEGFVFEAEHLEQNFPKFQKPQNGPLKIISNNPISYISYTKCEIDGFRQRNPQSAQDYIELIEYCVIDTLLTSNLSILSKNQIFCHGSSINQLPIYSAYYQKSGNIANYADTSLKYKHFINCKNMANWKKLILYITCLINAKKTDEISYNFNMKKFKYGKACEFEIATKISDLFSGEKDISETNLKIIAESPINSLDNLCVCIEKLLNN